MTDLIVTHAHMRSLGYCNRGAREWFARKGLSWTKFRKDGLSISELERTGDAMAMRLCKAVRDGR